ncbi:MAG: apolipoprotein N-acyltransferase [Deltaproteobacteria bacterium]|nr:apolipoprotein N-acyltransferase [Deltaproteobacteria bacterium]
MSPPRALRALRAHPRGLAACALSGVMTFMAFPNAWSPELNLWWLMWVSHVPVTLWLLDERAGPALGAPGAARWGFWWGYLCGFIINTGGYYWIAELAETFGHLPPAVSNLVLLLHSALVGLIWGVWGALVRALGGRVDVAWLSPVAMVAAEHFMPRVFPAYMGDCQQPFLPIMQVADLFGVSAVTFVLYRVNAELALSWRARGEGAEGWWRARRGSLKATGALFGLTLLYGLARIPMVDAEVAAAPKLRVGVVEPDIGIFEAEPADRRRDHLLVLQRLSQRAVEEGAELLVWSESAYRAGTLPGDARRLPPSDAPLAASWREDEARRTPRADRAAPQRGFRAPLLMGAGAVEVDEATRERRYYNSAWLLSADGDVLGRYDKIVRLVFGEYIPFGDTFPVFYKWLPSASRLERGEGVRALTLPLADGGEARLGVLICYEGILPGFARDVFDLNPDLLVNITNDAWFGLSAERYLHFALALPRAIESRRAFVRATLNGVSAVVDPVGRIVDWTRPTGEEVIVRDVPLMRPWTLYQVIGDALAWGCALVALAWAAAGRWRGGRAPKALAPDVAPAGEGP